jgi:hypothetical protein
VTGRGLNPVNSEKITGLNVGKGDPGSRAAGVVKSGGSSGGNPALTGNITSLLASLKLPGGEFSASILSFAKFFSLPLDGPFLGKIRQRALAGQGGGESPSGRGEKTGVSPPVSGFQFREALALAALASAAKGLELTPQALAAYAKALLHGLSPEDGEADSLAEKTGGQAAEGRRVPVERPDPPGDRNSGARNGAAFGGEDRGSEASPKKESPGSYSPASIQKLALAAQDPLLDILNQVPGKDGKRWIVLPFSLEGLDVCLRLLLAGPRAELMGLDVRNGELAWQFILRPGISGAGDTGHGEEGPPPWSLELFCSPAPGKGWIKAVERELAEFLGLPAEKIRVRGEKLPLFAESRDWTLPSINKEV